MEKKEPQIILENWSENNPILWDYELGWNEDDARDALSEDPQKIFKYYLNMPFSFALFHAINQQFYLFFLESYPLEVRRLPLNPDWDGKFIVQKVLWDFHSKEELLASFSDDDDIWNNLVLDGFVLRDIIPNSLLIQI